MPESLTADRVTAGAQPAGVHLRQLTPNDGAAVIRLIAQLGRAGEPDHWRQRLEPLGHGRPICWAVEVEGRLVALVLGHARSGDFGQPAEVGWLEALAVETAWHGRGLARLLAEAFFEDCASRGVSRAATLVSLKDQPLRGFFRTLGFRQSQLLCVERRV